MNRFSVTLSDDLNREIERVPRESETNKNEILRKALQLYLAAYDGKKKNKKLALKYWDVIAEDLDLDPISERQLRDRLKKISHHPGEPATFIFQLFPGLGQ